MTAAKLEAQAAQLYRRTQPRSLTTPKSDYQQLCPCQRGESPNAIRIDTVETTGSIPVVRCLLRLINIHALDSWI